MTHINAYYADVDEAEKQVLAAHAAWEAAKARLADKKQQEEIEEKQIVQTPEPKKRTTDKKEEKEDTEEASSPVGTTDEKVEDLFFLGKGGRTLPGISVRSLLCNFANSP